MLKTNPISERGPRAHHGSLLGEHGEPSMSRANRSRPFLAALLWVLVSGSAGCAANHAFPHDAPLDVPALADELEALAEGEDALFDLTYWPLVHLDLETFSENTETENYSAGHQYISLRSWLPFFLFVDGEIARFDDENAAYEENEFTALLWGLWARTESTVQTLHGGRTERNGRFLWILSWEESVDYDEPKPQTR